MLFHWLETHLDEQMAQALGKEVTLNDTPCLSSGQGRAYACSSVRENKEALAEQLEQQERNLAVMRARYSH